MFLVRGNPVTPGAPGTPSVAVATLNGSTLRVTPSGTAAAGWKSWEVQYSATSSSGPWTTLESARSAIAFPLDVTGLTAGVTYWFRVKGTDNVGQVSAYSSAVSGATTSKSSTPGFYIRPDAFGYYTKDAQRLATYDKIIPYPNIRGAEIPICWGRIEPVQGQYNWASVEADINRITQNRTNGKKVILALAFQNYGITSIPSTPQSQFGAVIVPDYIIDAGWCALRTGNGLMPKLDISGCMDRLIAWVQACAAQYDNDPYVEMVMIGETSSAYSGMSSSGYNTQWQRMPAVLAAAFPNTWAGVAHNGLASQAGSKTMSDLMVSNGNVHGTEDIIGFYDNEPPAGTWEGWGFWAVMGAGVQDGYDFGSTDSRMAIPIRAENQVIRNPNLSLAQINAVADNTWKSTHTVFVLYFGADGNSYTPSNYGGSTPVPQQSGDNVLAYLANTANGVARTVLP
ncbi:MAG TPA: fibronectin type III domain-containing protein [Dehalococcoidia bacterium]|nr:fibronectin type III domain-containing protein [Dehalococcoidia bacterium]